MPEFNVSYGPEPVKWDFSGITDIKGEPFGEDAKGTVPEASGAAIRAFARSLQKASSDQMMPFMDHPLEWLTAIRRYEHGDGVELKEGQDKPELLSAPQLEKALNANSARIAKAVADLTQGNPTAETFLRLPEVYRTQFVQYLIENFVSPESRGAGSKLKTRNAIVDAFGMSSGSASASL